MVTDVGGGLYTDGKQYKEGRMINKQKRVYIYVLMFFFMMACGDSPPIIDNDQDPVIEQDPVIVPAMELYNFKFQEDKIASNPYSSCQIDTKGALYCWGENDLGQLGDGTNVNNFDKIRIEVFEEGDLDKPITFKQISGGHRHFCALTTDQNSTKTNMIYCWGYGADGRLANFSTLNQNTPEPIDMSGHSLDHDFEYVSTGFDHTCAIHKSLTLLCWGNRANQAFGEADLNIFDKSNSIYYPVAVRPGDETFENKFVHVSAGDKYTCAIAITLKGYCWGRGTSGELGIGSEESQTYPTEISLNQPNVKNLWRKIQTGPGRTCGINIDDVLFCWGQGDSDLLGVSDPPGQYDARYPADVVMRDEKIENKFIDITLSESHSCAVHISQRLYCWGYNGSKVLGTQEIGKQYLPIAVGDDFLVPELNITGAAIGRQHTCAITNLGNSYCFGDNSKGQLGQ